MAAVLYSSRVDLGLVRTFCTDSTTTVLVSGLVPVATGTWHDDTRSVQLNSCVSC